MSFVQNSEINPGNIPENIPRISATFFAKNSVLYNREYPLDVTFGEILSDFEKNIQDEELRNKIEYTYKNQKINKEDKILDKVTPSPGSKLLDVEICLDISNIDLPKTGDEKLTYKTIIIPQGESAENDNTESKPFRLIVYKPEEGRITMEKYPKEKNIQYSLSSYCDDTSSFCNSNNALYMSGGERNNKPTKDFWRISHNREQLEYKQMPCCKKNHSMIFIPNNCVFIVGGNSKNTFYYDTKKDIFCKWAELNNPSEKPALSLVDNRYLYSFPSDSCEFERSDLKSNPSWEKITPMMKDDCQFNLKNYNVGSDKDGNIILYGGDNENEANGYYYIYNPTTNEMEESMGFNKNVVSKDKQFYPINNYNSVLFPKNFEEDNSIYVMKKNGNVQPYNFNIEENEKYSKNYIDYKDPAKQIDGKLLIKTREELIPTTNDIELMKKQKNKQPIDYSILSPYLKGIIKDLKEKEEIKKKEEEARKPEEVGEDNIIVNEDDFGQITDPENPTVLKSKSKWTKPRNIVNLGIPKLVKRSKELEKIKDSERDNRKEEIITPMKIDVEPKKEQEEVIKPVNNNEEEEPFEIDDNINDNIDRYKRFRKGETLPLPKRPEMIQMKKSSEIAEMPDDFDDDDKVNKNYTVQEPNFDVYNNTNDDYIDSQNNDINGNKPDFLEEIISKSPDDDIKLNIKKINPDKYNVENFEGEIPGQEKKNLINPNVRIKGNENNDSNNYEIDDGEEEITGEIKGFSPNQRGAHINVRPSNIKNKEKENNYNLEGEIPGKTGLNLHTPDVNISESGKINQPDINDSGGEYEISGEIPGVKKPEAKVNIKPPTVDIKAPKVDVKKPEAKVNIKPPTVDIKAPKVDVKKPEAKVEIKPPTVDIKAPKVDVKKPEAKVEIKPPTIDIKTPKVDVKKPEAKVNIKPPTVDIKQPKVDIESPEYNLDIQGESPEIDISADPSLRKGKSDKIKVNPPNIKINQPQVQKKINLEAPDIKQKKKSEIVNIEYEKPSIPNFSGGIDFESPYVNIDTKESLKSKDQGKIKLEPPKAQKTKETAPSISINKPKKPTIKEVKVTAPRISLKAPEINKKSKETSLEIERGNEKKIEVPRVKIRSSKYMNTSGDIENEAKLGKGIVYEGGNILTLTQLMSLDVNDPINLDDNWQRENKWNKYGGYEIGVPDYHLVYENRGNEGNEDNINIEDGNIEGGKINVKGGNYNVNIDGKVENIEDIGFDPNLDEGEYNIEIDHMGYSQPMNFDVEIPEDLNLIPNSKVKKRVHNPKPKEKPSVNAFEYGAEGRIRDSLRVTYPPGYDDTSIVMNYSKLPPLHYTINQQPKDNIPLCKQWNMDDFDINLVADYKP